jgi:hypothetical protein
MIQKQTASINFAQALDLKTDPFQLDFGRFLSLQNMVFSTGKRMTKRNGFGALPSVQAEYVTTLAGTLTAIGTQVQAYSAGSEVWTDLGNFYPCNLSALPVVRAATNQSQVDSVVSPTGLLLMAWADQNPGSLAAKQFRYAVFDSTTGQTLLEAQTISDADVAGPYGFPRTFVLGGYFIVVYITSSTNHLKYIQIPISTLIPGSGAVISTSIAPSSTVAFDGVVYNNSLYLAWNGASSSGVKMAFLTSTLSLSSAHVVDSSHQGTMFSVAVDAPSATIWASYYNLSGTVGYAVAVSSALNSILAATEIIASGTVLNLTSVAAANVLTLFYEVSNTYSYDSGIHSNLIKTNTLTVGGTLGTASTLIRSVGLASKAFALGGVNYFLSAYSSPYQPTYFLIDGANGNVVAEVAYENGGGYLANGLPSVSVNTTNSTASVGYLYKDLIQAISNANAAGTSVVGGIYSQTGINQATFTIGGAATITATEMAGNLNISGGFLWGYDGTQTTEQGFFLYPDSVESTANASTGGFMGAYKYWYQVVESWTDSRGNIFYSAGSIPVLVDLSGSGTATNTVTLAGPNLRLTYKQNVKHNIYRYSTNQPEWFLVQSVATPLLNSTTADSWSYTDTLADASISGNQLLYTTGGVVEDTGGPSFVSTFTFDDRLFGIYSEDRNLVGFSKQIIEGTPVELSDLLTLYVAPSLGAQGPTGALACGAAMDDKAILFKPTALYYINGTGPDNTGSNSQYSQPTFITSMVGCSNQASIVFQPNGLMFEFASAAGNQIWLLGRDLGTRYIGDAVEGLTLGANILSAVSIPGTNQVRFDLDSGIRLMYDYFFDKWSVHTNNSVSSTLYQGLHTYISPTGLVFQETPDAYLDGSTPVLMQFTTGWISPSGLQGYQRAYWFYFLGQYLSPHKIQLGIAYDYNPYATQFPLISPNNYAGAYGSGPYGGQSPYGGPGQLEQWKIYLTQQRCQAFQIQFQEIYDPSFGVPPGAGLSVSGLNLVFGQKKGYVPLPFSQGAS